MSIIGSTMSEREKLLIVNSWKSLSNEYKIVAHTFYEKLFILEPNLKQLFKNDIRIQEIKFMDSLDYLLKRMDNLEESTKKMKKLGLKHKGYGTKVKHYTVFWKALQYTFEFYLKDEYTEEVHIAWEKLYESVAESMILGSKRK
ncbi:MAG: Bacterial hemoglobin [Candidatus Heimdallarchaeota archaeon LC_2]|nr:MAG: Bacterial hemoglobin [Candidatus Heimdallarchaeota archaeon LC_2]